MGRRKKSIETNLEMTQMIESVDKDFKTVSKTESYMSKKGKGSDIWKVQ